MLQSANMTSVPAEIGQLTTNPLPLEKLHLERSAILRRQSADERAGGIWQLTALDGLYLTGNQLTSVPAEIGQLTSLRWLHLNGNQLTSNALTFGGDHGQLTSLEKLWLYSNQLTSVPAEIGQLTSLEKL